MSSDFNIKLTSYRLKHKNNTKWLNTLSYFPKLLQYEISIERPNGTRDDIEEIKKWKLKSPQPIMITNYDLLESEINLDTISRCPGNVINYINKKWGLSVLQGYNYDKNNDRYFKYANLPSETANPSVMLNGEIIWGVGRFIASLIRGDKFLTVWNIISK